MKFSEKDMAALISEVETGFAEHLSKAEKEQEVTLAKSENSSEVTKTKENSANINKSESKKSLDYDEEDFAEMEKLYTGMNKAEAEAHYKSVKKAIFGGEAEKKETIKKSETEVKIEKSEIKEDDSIAKSEYEAVVTKNEELQKSLEGLTSALGTFLKGNAKAPKQKAITKMEYVKKSEVEKSEDIKEISIGNLYYKSLNEKRELTFYEKLKWKLWKIYDKV